jgi:hypothetical protein
MNYAVKSTYQERPDFETFRQGLIGGLQEHLGVEPKYYMGSDTKADFQWSDKRVQVRGITPYGKMGGQRVSTNFHFSISTKNTQGSGIDDVVQAAVGADSNVELRK